MGAAAENLQNIAVFPMKKPEMQIGKPETVNSPDVKDECEYARNDATWD